MRKLRGWVACPESHSKLPGQDLASGPFKAKAHVLSQPASHLLTGLLESQFPQEGRRGAWCSGQLWRCRAGKLPGPSPHLCPQGCTQLSSSPTAQSFFPTSHPVLGSGSVFFSSPGWECLLLSGQLIIIFCSNTSAVRGPILLHPQTPQPLGPRSPPGVHPYLYLWGKQSPPWPPELLTAAGPGAAGPFCSSTLAIPFQSLLISRPTAEVAESSEADNPR